MNRYLFAILSATAMAACAAADGSGDQAEDPNAIIHVGECDQADFTVEAGRASFGRIAGRQYLRYVAEGTGDRHDRIEFISYLLPEDNGEPLPPGSYNVSADDGNDGDPTVRAYRDCQDGVCNEMYQATGVVVIEASGGVDGTFKARLNNVTFEEMEDDGSEPRRGGLSFCGSALRWDTTVESDAMGECVAEGEGSDLGDRTRDMVLPNCYGNRIGQHDTCGRVKAQLIASTAGWCSACRQRLPGIEASIQTLKDQGHAVEAYYILGDGNRRSVAATVQECFADAQSKSIDPARVLLDTGNGRRSFNELFYSNPEWVSSCDRYLPYFWVLDGDDMSLTFRSTSQDGTCPTGEYSDFNDAITALLQD